MEKTSRKKEITSEKHTLKEGTIEELNTIPGQFKTLIINGEKYKTILSKKYENRKKWAMPNEKNVYSFIPGTVDEIFIREGQQVKKGDKMLKLEAMKMLNLFEIPISGKIKKINIKKGDRIPKGFLMIEFE
jgi:biotin carboxyl carrier protein